MKRDFRLLKRRKKDRGSQKCFYFQGRLFILPTPTLYTLTRPPSEKLADLKTDSVSLWKYKEMHLLCCLGKDAGISESSAAARASVGSESVSSDRGSVRPRPQLLPLISFHFLFFYFLFLHIIHHFCLVSSAGRQNVFFLPHFYYMTATDISQKALPPPQTPWISFCGTYLCNYFQSQLKGQSDQH